MLAGVAADLLEPVGWAGANGVGGKADLDAALPEPLDLVQVLGNRRLPEAVEAAPCVCDVEEDECDPGCVGGLSRGESLLEAEVVELADCCVARRPHLAVDLLVVGTDPVGALLVGEVEHRVAPGPEVAASVRPRRARWKAWLCALTKPGIVKRFATECIKPGSPGLLPNAIVTDKANVSVTKSEQIGTNRSTAATLAD